MSVLGGKQQKVDLGNGVRVNPAMLDWSDEQLATWETRYAGPGAGRQAAIVRQTAAAVRAYKASPTFGANVPMTGAKLASTQVAAAQSAAARTRTEIAGARRSVLGQY